MFDHDDEHKDSTTHMGTMTQWVASIAVAVVCCAVIFIVFSGYVVRLNELNGVLSLRITLLQTRNEQLLAEIERVRKTQETAAQQRQQQPAATPPAVSDASVPSPETAPQQEGGGALLPIPSPSDIMIPMGTLPPEDIIPAPVRTGKP